MASGGAQLRQAEGFISARFHQSLDPTTKFRFINVAEWASPQHFEAATRGTKFTELRGKLPFVAHPALYKVAVTEDLQP